MKSDELFRLIREKRTPIVLDVRSGFEYGAGHIDGAIHIPFWAIPFTTSPLPRDRGVRIVITCEHGPRAVLAQLLLSLRGYRNTELLEGHMAGWKRRGFPMTLTGTRNPRH